MRSKVKTGKIYWRRNIPIDGEHYIDVCINLLDNIVVAEMFTNVTPRAVIYIGMFRYPCNYIQKAIENSLRCRKDYDMWCKDGLIEDIYM